MITKTLSLRCCWLSRGKILFILPLLLLASLFSGVMNISQVHAASGTVCLADASVPPCPSTAPVFDGPVGQQIRIGVFISGSDGLDGFTITTHALANQTLLTPAGIDLTGTVLLGVPVIVNECLGGQLIHGSTCNPQDTIDTIDLSATSALGQPLTTAPTTGLLFTAIYNITATNPSGSPVSVGFKVYSKGTSCSGTNTSVPPDTCVAVANGTSNLLSETVQTGATFDNSASATLADVTVNANVTSFGPEFPGISNAAKITATAHNGYPTFAGDSVTFSTIPASGQNGLTISIIGANPCTTNGASCNVNVTLSDSNPGTYSVTVYGTYPTQDAASNPDTLSANVTLTLVVDDFTLSVSPTAVSFGSGEAATATAILTSVNGFSGSITLSPGTILPAGLTLSFSPNPIVLIGGESLNSTITLKASPSAVTNYQVHVKATSGTRSKTSGTITAAVAKPISEFYIVSTPNTVGPTNVGASGTSTVTVGYANGFTGSVTVSASSSSTKLTAGLNMTSLTTAHNATLTVTGSVAANYMVTVTASNSSRTVSTSVFVTVVDFNVTAASNALSVVPGGFKTTTINVIPFNSFDKFGNTVGLSATAPTGLTATIKPGSIVGSGMATLNVTASLTTSQGLYKVNVTGVNLSLQHIAEVNVTVVPPDFSISATPVAVFGAPGTNVTSAILVSSLHGFSGTVTLTLQSPTGVKASLNATSVNVPLSGSRTSVLTVNATASGSYLLNITGTSGSIIHTVSVRFTSSDKFDITFFQSTLTVEEGSSTTIKALVATQPGFTGTINLKTVVTPPPGFTGGAIPTASVSPLSVTLGSSSSVNVTVTVTVSKSVHSNLFGIQVNGTFGAKFVLSSPNSLTVPPSAFTITSSPTTVTIGPGKSGTSTVTVAAQGGLYGPISLLLNIPSGVSCSLGLSTVNVLVDGSNHTSLTCTASVGSVGSFNVSIAGTGMTPYNVTIPSTPGPGSAVFVVADFTVASTPSGGIVVNASQNGYANISISWTNNYKGNVTLTVKPVAGLTLSLNPTTLTGPGSTKLTVFSGTAGTYTLVINATSGTTSKSVTISLTVLANTSGTSNLVLYAGIGVVVAAVVAGAAFLLYRRGKTSKPKVPK